MGRKAVEPTAEQTDKIARHVGPYGLTGAFRMAGVAPRTGYAWLDKGRQPDAEPAYADYARRIDEALGAACAVLMAPLLTAVRPPSQRTEDDPTYDPRLAIDVSKWLLERRFPEEFGNRIKSEISGPDGKPVQTDATLTVLPGVVVLPPEEAIPEPSPEVLARDAKRAEQAAERRAEAASGTEPSIGSVLAKVELPKPATEAPKPKAPPPTVTPSAPVEADAGYDPMAAIRARDRARDNARDLGGGRGW